MKEAGSEDQENFITNRYSIVVQRLYDVICCVGMVVLLKNTDKKVMVRKFCLWVAQVPLLASELWVIQSL